jgi:peptidoglycan/xylan/chitin deacetylase (PgdA/CDA1 family)
VIVPALGRGRRMLNHLRVRHRPAAAILIYHRISERPTDPWGLSVTPRAFDEQMYHLRTTGTCLTLGELIKRWQSGRAPRRAFVVTFDDGYRDVLLAARPLLQRNDVPATVFLNSALLASGRAFWWDFLERVFLHPGVLPAELALTINGKDETFALGEDAAYGEDAFAARRGWSADDDEAPGPRQRVFLEVWRRLFKLTSVEREPVLSAIATWAGADIRGEAAGWPLTEPEALALDDPRLIEIGGHSLTHPSLPDLRTAERRLEVAGDKGRLEALFGRPIESFSYPFGRFDDDTARTVRQAGYRSACTSQDGAARRGGDPWRLPRIHARNWDGDALAASLRSRLPGLAA